MISIQKLYVSCLALCGILALTGCQMSTDEPDAQITFQHMEPIAVAVRDIYLTNTFQGTGNSDQTKAEAPQQPAEVLGNWSRQRFSAAGSPQGDVLEIVMTQAFIREVPLAKQGGITGLFTDEPDVRFDGRLGIELRLITPSGFQKAYLQAAATHSQTLSESASLRERERALQRLSKALIHDLDKEVVRRLDPHFTPYLR